MTDGERYGRDYGRGGQIPGSGYGHGSGPDFAAAPEVVPGEAYRPGSAYQNGAGHPPGSVHPDGGGYPTGGHPNGGGYANGSGYPDGGGYANGNGHANGGGWPPPAARQGAPAPSGAQPPYTGSAPYSGQPYGGRPQFGRRTAAAPPPAAGVTRHVPGRAEPWRSGRGVAQVPGRFRELPPDGPGPRERPVRKPMPLWQELPLLLVVAFCLAVLIRTFLLQAFFIPSGSMEDTLLVGDRVLVNKVVYDIREPARGEVVVFSGTDAWVPENIAEEDASFLARVGRTLGDLVGVSRPGEKDFIKRVIGVPGDRVSCCDDAGRVVVNGYALDESGYVLADSPLDAPEGAGTCRSRQFEEIVVQPGQIFVMGDHRLVSQDSRCQGPVPIENVIGRAFVIVWPNSRWHSLSAPETFRNVPLPAAAEAGTEPTPEAAGAPGGFGRPDGPPVVDLPAVLVLSLIPGLIGRVRVVPYASHTRRVVGSASD